MRILKDVTVIDLAETISRSLSRREIEKLVVREELFSLDDVQDGELAAQRSNESLVQHILTTLSYSNIFNESVKRDEMLNAINAFYNKVGSSKRFEIVKIMENDDYKFVDGEFVYLDPEDIAEEPVHVSKKKKIVSTRSNVSLGRETQKPTIRKKPKIQPIVLGHGHFCIVHSHKDENTNNCFARKTLKKEHRNNLDYVERFRREVDILKTLQGNHHIIRLLDYNTSSSDSELWYDAEQADMNLYKFYRAKNQVLADDDRLAIFDQILYAIEFAHKQKIIHRDLSPNNVLVWDTIASPLVKVADFGLGRVQDQLEQFTKSAIRDYGQILYVAPEQKDKLSSSTYKSDIFSLGKLLSFVWTGKDPNSQDQNSPFAELINKATCTDPEDRYSDIQAMKAHYGKIKDIILTSH